MQRFKLVTTNIQDQHQVFANEVRNGLTHSPKRLGCRFIYDERGSQLFEEICSLPEYYPTRTEAAILDANADAITAALPRGAAIVELGSGSAAKTRLLIQAMLHRQDSLRFIPIDISPTIIEESSQQLIEDYARLNVLGIAAEYEEGLRHLEKIEAPKLILWLGSSIGNMHHTEGTRFLKLVRQQMNQDDRVLLGADLRKDRAILEPAYNDRQGVTAQFNLNLLTRINRELGGQFDLNMFRHRAEFNDDAGRVESHLISQEDQRVPIDKLGLVINLARQERVHTENSYKYTLAELVALARSANLAVADQWFDEKNWFSVNLLQPA